MNKKIVLAAPNIPSVTSSMTNLEFAQVLEDAFDRPTPLIQDLLRRFAKLAEAESGEDQIEGQDVPISCQCPVCGSTVDLTLE